LKFRPFVGWFGASGALVALFFEAGWWLANHANPGSLPAGALELERACEKATLLFWPSSIYMMAIDNAPPSSAFFLFLITALLNAVLYSTIGAGLWYGLFKRHAVLVVPIFLIAGMWWWLLEL
jgi:hypothetical protein